MQATDLGYDIEIKDILVASEYLFREMHPNAGNSQCSCRFRFAYIRNSKRLKYQIIEHS